MSQYLSEAFKSLDTLNEETFSVDEKGLKELEKFKENNDNDIIDIIDANAETVEDLEDSYEGKVILDCCVCHSKQYKDVEDVYVEDDLANIGEECPFCFTNDGFKIVGQVAPYNSEVASEESDVELKESMEQDLKESGGAGFRLDTKDILDIEDLADAVYKDDEEYIKKYVSKVNPDITVKDLSIAVENSDYPREIKNLIAHMKHKGYETIGDFNKAINESIATIDKPISEIKGTLGNVLTAHADELSQVYDAKSALQFLDSIEPEVEQKDYFKKVRLDIIKNPRGAVNYLYNIILKGDGMGRENETIREGIFDKKSKADINNASKKFESEISLASDGKSLTDLASDMFNLLVNSVEEYRIKQDKINDKNDTSHASASNINEAKAKQILQIYTELAKAFKKPNNFSQAPSAIKRAMSQILGSFASESQSLDEMDDYSDILLNISNLNADKNIKQEALKRFFNTLVYRIENEIQRIKRFKYIGQLLESVNQVDVKTDDAIVKVETDEQGKITVTTETVEVDEKETETIIPTEIETQNEIEDNVPSGEEIEIDIDEFDEESFDELGENYLKEIYNNIDSYKTSKVTLDENFLKLDGVIKFKSGNSKNTSFLFEAKAATKTGKVKFIGENNQITKGKKAFTITGKVDNNKFLSESLNYNYGAKMPNGKIKRLYGTIKKSI